MSDRFDELRQKARRWMPPALLRQTNARPIVLWVEAAAWLLGVVQHEFEEDLNLFPDALPAYELLSVAFREWLRGNRPSNFVDDHDVSIAFSMVPTSLFGTRLGIEIAVQALLMRVGGLGPASVDIRVQERIRTFDNDNPFTLGSNESLLGHGATLGSLMSLCGGTATVLVDIRNWPSRAKLNTPIGWANIWEMISVLIDRVAGGECVLRLTLPASASPSVLSAGCLLGRGFTLGREEHVMRANS